MEEEKRARLMDGVKTNRRERQRPYRGTQKRKGKEAAMWHIEAVGDRGQSQPGQTTQRALLPGGQQSQEQAPTGPT